MRDPGRNQESRTTVKPFERIDVQGTPGVVNDEKDSEAGKELSQSSGGTIDGLKSGSFFLGPSSNEVPNSRESSGLGEILPHRHPENAIRIGFPDPRVKAELLGKGGLSESPGAS